MTHRSPEDSRPTNPPGSHVLRTLVLVVALAGCAAGGATRGAPEAGAPDTSYSDVAAADASERDAGSVTDAAADAMLVDAGLADAAADAFFVDASLADAALADAALADAGTSCPAGCVPPEHARLTCGDGACGFSCDSGWVRRGDVCIPELPCSPGLVGTPVRVTTDGNRNNSPAVAVSGGAAAVFWTRGAIGNPTRDVYARFYDYPSLTPRTEVLLVAAASLEATSRIDLVPISTGFAVLYDRTSGTSGTTTCTIALYDRDGGRSYGAGDATRGDACQQHAFAGSAAGLAIAWRSSRLNARYFALDSGTLSGGIRMLISSNGGTGGGDHIAWHPDRGDFRIAYTVFNSGLATLMTSTASTASFRTSVDVPAVAGFASTQTPELVAAGPGYGLLFAGRMTSGDAQQRYLVALDRDGAAAGVPRSVGSPTRAALAAGPHELGLVVGGSDVEVRVYDLTATPIGAPTAVATGPSRSDWPDIAWGDDGFLVGWSDDVAAANRDDIYLARVCPAR